MAKCRLSSCNMQTWLKRQNSHNICSPPVKLLKHISKIKNIFFWIFKLPSPKLRMYKSPDIPNLSEHLQDPKSTREHSHYLTLISSFVDNFL